MAYQSGDIIRLELNTLNTSINTLRGDNNSGATGSATGGLGYGQTNITTNIAIGQTITAAQWTQLLSSVNQVATHQGTANVVPTSVSSGATITAISNLNSFLNTLTTNRFNIAASNLTTTTNGTRLVSQRTTTWDGEIFHIYNVNFSSWNAMRYFFNTGGRIISRPSYSGGSSSADATWNTFVNAIGNVTLNHSTFYTLSTSFSTIGTFTSGSESVRYRARLTSNAGLASTIQIEMRASSPNDGNQLNGTLTNRVDDGRSTGVFNIPAPSYSTSTPLSGGGTVPAPISNVVITGGGTQQCEYVTGGCFIDFNLSASVTNGTGNFGYSWSLTDTTNYSILSGQGTNNIVVRSSNGTTSLPTATVNLTVSDIDMTPVTFSASTTIKANKVASTPDFTATNISGSAGTQVCRWDFDGSTHPTTCSTTWSLTTTNSGGSGSYSYAWSVGSGFSISGSSTSQSVTIVSASGTTDISGTVSVSVTDTSLGTVRSDTYSITAQRRPGAITSTTVTNTSGTTSCSIVSPATTCSASSFWTTQVVGGSGSYTYSLIKNSGVATITGNITPTTGNITLTSNSTAGTYACSFTVTATDNDTRKLAATDPSQQFSDTFTHTAAIVPGEDADYGGTYQVTGSFSGNPSAQAELELELNSSGAFTITSFYSESGSVLSNTLASGTWLPSGSPGDWQVQITRSAGTGVSGTTIIPATSLPWSSLSTTRFCSLFIARNSGEPDQETIVFTIELRNVSNPSVVGTTVTTFTARVL
jgi:hypothetical protein